MTRNQYLKMTETVRKALLRVPGGEKVLRFPTYLAAFLYLAVAAYLALKGDARVVRVVLVPAVCFGTVTLLRPVINRQRPYDRFGAAPVGEWKRGKGKSMPSRHAVSAVAIVLAVIYAFPTVPVTVGMVLLGGVISALRVLSGQHYPSDVAAGVLLAVGISLIGYLL